MGSAFKRRLEVQCKAGINVCKSFMVESIRIRGIKNLQFDEKDVRNHVNAARRLTFGIGDAK
ncbi:hypothetical protein Scep_019607 [Stephania cephalantha]|uniref:Uncharacterized protein n=1 Tax=Stephania cephalantha TaxID=152367 RepID=A0AAP0NMB1_9MAGN